MARQVWAVVDVAVVLGQQVHVVEDEAVPGEVCQRLGVADVHEHGAVELVLVRLVDDVNSVVELLLPEEGVEVSEEDEELFLPVSVGHNDGNIEVCLTTLWAGLSPRDEVPVLSFNVCILRKIKMYREPPPEIWWNDITNFSRLVISLSGGSVTMETITICGTDCCRYIIHHSLFNIFYSIIGF